MLVVIVLFATVFLRALIVATGVYLMLPKAFSCPRCASKLTMIHHPILRHLLPRVEHRWCMRCGWSGIVRQVSPQAPVPQSREINRAAPS